MWHEALPFALVIPSVVDDSLLRLSEILSTSEVDGPIHQVVETGLLKRVLAQTEITFSNSLIDSWWRVLKHQWLYLNTLDTVTTVRKLVAFYIDQHNTHVPHSAFLGQIPDEDVLRNRQ